jgi:peptidoglycan/LPS O-acetylase OafA/YrhL
VKKPEYFPVLDSMRFVACVCVFLSHSIAFFPSEAGSLAFGRLFENAGYYGVIFFYSLSGFLITYLLVEEKTRTGTIAVRQFYVRRALRIWPLYYLMVGLSFFVLRYLLPQANWHDMLHPPLSLLLFILFLPNIAAVLGFYAPTCFHLYTIGYEEQFYLVWPLLVRKSSRRPVWMLTAAFFLPLLLSMVHQYLHSRSTLSSSGVSALVRGGLTFIDLSNIPAFAAGGAGAYIYLAAGEKWSKAMGARVWGYLLIAALVALMILGQPWATGYVNLLALIFVSLILHLIVRGRGRGFGGALFSSGGKISFGIYVYHPTVLLLVAGYIAKRPGLFGGHPLAAYAFYLIFSFVLVFGIASVSFARFERVFLRRKKEIFQPPADRG